MLQDLDWTKQPPVVEPPRLCSQLPGAFCRRCRKDCSCCMHYFLQSWCTSLHFCRWYFEDGLNLRLSLFERLASESQSLATLARFNRVFLLQHMSASALPWSQWQVIPAGCTRSAMVAPIWPAGRKNSTVSRWFLGGWMGQYGSRPTSDRGKPQKFWVMGDPVPFLQDVLDDAFPQIFQVSNCSIWVLLQSNFDRIPKWSLVVWFVVCTVRIWTFT